jgi:chemotaxis-related protein WspB
MLMLVFHINNQRYALPSQQVVEVIPLVNLTSLPHTDEYVVGVFNYRGSVVTVVDLCQLIVGKPCGEHLSTRIIIVKCCKSKQNQPSEIEGTFLLGLMAERVIETLHASHADLVDVNMQIGKTPYLGKMLLDKQGMIQYLPLEYLLSATEELNILTTG